MMIASTVISAAGVGMSAYTATQQANYEGKVAEANAHQANEAAHESILQGQRDQQQLYRQVSQTKGTQQAAMAASGIDTSFGSALNVQRDTAQMGQEDAATLQRNTESRTKGLDISAANYRGEASAASSRAFGAAVGGALNFGSTVLGGASQIGQYKRRVALGLP
jgi:hypothetical protein